jgi:hypothetical protein
MPKLYVPDELLKAITPGDSETASTGIRIGSHYGDVPAGCVGGNRGCLVLD